VSGGRAVTARLPLLLLESHEILGVGRRYAEMNQLNQLRGAAAIPIVAARSS
jgi:hypothetical protein